MEATITIETTDGLISYPRQQIRQLEGYLEAVNAPSGDYKVYLGATSAEVINVLDGRFTTLSELRLADFLLLDNGIIMCPELTLLEEPILTYKYAKIWCIWLYKARIIRAFFREETFGIIDPRSAFAIHARISAKYHQQLAISWLTGTNMVRETIVLDNTEECHRLRYMLVRKFPEIRSKILINSGDLP